MEVHRHALGKTSTLLTTAGERQHIQEEWKGNIHAIKKSSDLSAKDITNRKERRDVENKNDLGIHDGWLEKDYSRDKRLNNWDKRFVFALKLLAIFSP